MSLFGQFEGMKHFDTQTIYNTFLGLQPRQQTIALIGVGGLLFLLLLLPLFVTTSYLGGLEEDLTVAEEQLGSVVGDVQQYRSLQKDIQSIERAFKRQTNDSLLTIVQRLASEINITAERLSEKGRESEEFYETEKVSFYVGGVTLDQLVQLLHKIESSTQRIMKVRELVVKPTYGNRQLLNAEFKELAAYRLVTEGK